MWELQLRRAPSASGRAGRGDRPTFVRGLGAAPRRGLLGASVIALSIGAMASSAAAPARAAEGATIQELVVTAQKREQQLQDVPISISVVSKDTLESGPISTVNEALRGVPGVAFYENGQAGMVKFAVRGVTSNTSLFNGSSTVGYYIDEIPFAFVRYPVSPDVGAFDIERVEVLRGPQGTLYGANSLNGVIRIMTEDADLNEFGGRARATVSATKWGGENARGDVALNIPIAPGKLALRVVAGVSEMSGWLDRPATPHPILGSDPDKDVNNSRARNLRLKLNAQPTDNLDVEFFTWFSRTDRGAASDGPRGNRITQKRIPEPIDTDFDAYGLTLNYDFQAFAVTSATSHIKFENAGILDAGNDRLLTWIGSEMTSQEIRAVSTTAGPWRWSLGGIYRDARDFQFSDFTLKSVAGFTGVSDNIYTSESFAVYGEITRLLLDERLELTAGLRYFEDKAASNERQALSTAAGVFPFGVRKDKFDALTPRVVATYHPDDSSSIYASYSQGFRSGFAQNGEVQRLSGGLAPSIEPDLLTNYEIGAKGALLDGRLTYDLAAYYIDWDSTVQVVATTLGTGAGAFTFNGAVNAPGASGFGVDAGLTFRATDRLRLSGGFSWNGLEFDRDVLSGGRVIFDKGMRLAESPEYTANAGIAYDVPLSAGFAAELAASVGYTSRMYTGTLITAGGPFYSDEITQVRASARLISPANWSATLFVDNLTNETGFVRGSGNPAASTGDHLRPRTIGLQLDLDF